MLVAGAAQQMVRVLLLALVVWVAVAMGKQLQLATETLVQEQPIQAVEVEDTPDNKLRQLLEVLVLAAPESLLSRYQTPA
jgi:hypothetical protein